MAIKDKDLIEKLTALRNELRISYDKKICSDEAIIEMAVLKPKKITDFDAILGLDGDFIDTYSNLFISIIQTDKNHPTKLNKAHLKLLHHFKDRLSNISKRNPNLYMGKIEKNKNFDLSVIESKRLIGFLSLAYSDITFDANDDLQTNHLTTLYRELHKDFKEYGSHDLYIGYPYVEGKLKKSELDIKAPLALFPVTLSRVKKQFKLIKDNQKDIIINRDLILAISKEQTESIDHDMPYIKDLSNHSIDTLILPYYQKHGLIIKSEQTPFMPFESMRKASFIKLKREMFQYKPYITFGRYKLYASMIQRDMALIMKKQVSNDLLDGLIDETYIHAKEAPYKSIQKQSIDESNITYTNALNYAQEATIDLSNKKNKLVIYGPPGTGKSQTIKSLISNQVLKGENVLVVSEKKVALDVIYARLKDNQKYVLFLDDASNKQSFYNQLSNLLDLVPPKRSENNDTYRIEEAIQILTNRMNASTNLLYSNIEKDTALYKLYARYIKDKDIIPHLSPNYIYQKLYRDLSKPSFKDIETLETVFDKDLKLNNHLIYHFFNKKYPWFKHLETKVTRSNILFFESMLEALETSKEKYEKTMFFKKKRVYNAFIESYLDKLAFLVPRKKTIKPFLKALYFDRDLYLYLISNIKKLNKHKETYKALSKTSKQFLDFYQNLPNYDDTYYKKRSYVFDAFYTGFLENIKAKHQDSLYLLEDYLKYYQAFSDQMDKKRIITEETFQMSLFQSALHLSNTKRIMDIRRILESDQKPSVKAFFDHFYVELSKHIKVFLMTPEVISTLIPLEQNLFDLVIFDEASQLYVEKGIPAIYRARKVIIAGDPKQLRPSLLGVGRMDEADDTIDILDKDLNLDAKSLLDLARYRYDETLLNYHYRSQYEELIAFSNHAFYEGKLFISPNQSKPKNSPIEYIYVEDGQFIQRQNKAEAQAVIKLLKKVLKEKKPEESVGIITFNSNQRDLITNLIDEVVFEKSVHQRRFEQELYKSNTNSDDSLFIKNIENVQGDERDIIIFSMGYGKDEAGLVKRRFGWLNHEGGQNRLNVAITRARKKIYFVSSLYPEHLKVDDLTGVGPKLLKDFMRYCYFVSKNDQDMVKLVLNELHQTPSKTDHAIKNQMVLDVKEKVEKMGYVVHLDIGIGGFNIDMAIYDEKTETYKLGILCDLDIKEKHNARLELIHQDRFLEAKGWHIYRLFHMNYYTNPNKEMKSIKQYLP
jgi:superfamily I DNA and/or RNA helicase